MKKAVVDMQMCKTCGGRCCNGHPGKFVVPERFFEMYPECKKMNEKELEDFLDGRGYELWKFDTSPIPRPKPGYNGCYFLSETGCTLKREEMPCQCLALIPDAKTLVDGQMVHCRMPVEFSSETAVKNWNNYWNRRMED